MGLVLLGGYVLEEGGGVHNAGELHMMECTVANCHGYHYGRLALGGGGIFNTGTLSMSNCNVSGNAGWRGGGVFNVGALSMSECIVSGNNADAAYGGGVFNKGTLSMKKCAVSGNRAGMGGGGVFNSNRGTVSMDDCTVSGNRAGTDGGGVHNGGYSLAALSGITLTMVRSLVFGNSAFGGGGGGAYCASSCNLTLTNFSSNAATGDLSEGRRFPGCSLHNTAETVLHMSFIQADVGSDPRSSCISGQAVFNGGELTYVLPAPQGYHLDGVFLCHEQRCPCNTLGCPDPDDGTKPCDVQSCNVSSFGGAHLSKLPQGDIDTVPKPCAPGFFASSVDVDTQNSDVCSGPCARSQGSKRHRPLDRVAWALSGSLPLRQVQSCITVTKRPLCNQSAVQLAPSTPLLAQPTPMAVCNVWRAHIC
jgi:hypothetical protein